MQAIKRSLELFFILVLTGSVGLQAQSALFLLISPVTTFNGMGEIGVGLPDEDQGAAYYNPANGFINSPGLTLSESNMHTEWLPGLVDDMFLEHDQFRVSYRLAQYPWQFNLQQFETYLDAGEQQYTDPHGVSLGTFQTWFRANALVLAAQYSGSVRGIPLKFSYGVARKDVIQHLTDDGFNTDESIGQAENVVYDRGLLLGMPLELKLKHDQILTVEASFGMSKVNIGDSVIFSHPESADPLPTSRRVGIGISASLPLSASWNLLQYRAGNAAFDDLVKPRSSGDEPIEYQQGFGDINLIKHLLMSEPDEDPERGHDVIISHGQELNFLDCYTIRFGKYIDIRGKVVTPQSGISYHSKGLLNLAYLITGIQLIDVINQHVELSYSYADWQAAETHPLYGTKFESWNFTVKDILGIPGSLQARSRPTPLRLNDLFTLTLGVNYPQPIVSSPNSVVDWKSSAGYTAGIETELKYFRLGLNLTETRFAYDFEILPASLFSTELKDEVYQLGLYGMVPFQIGSRLIVMGGPQLQSPLIHRKITIWDQTIDDTNYEYNYGLRAGLEIKLTKHFSARGSYSYWDREIESYSSLGEKVKLSSWQLEALVRL